MGRRMTRQEYAELFGPTTGDRVRLGDTELWAEVEEDLLVPGDECVFGGGKTLRDGLGVHGGITAAEGALDFVITNALVIDAVLGIVKADIGIKDGRIVGVGKAGNPQIMDGVSPNMVIGANTDVRSAEGLIATAGAIDVHVHFDSAGLCEEAIASGITTMLGGGLGPVTVGITSSGTVNLGRMLQAAEAFPLNFGFLGNGSAYDVAPLLEQGRAGAVGLKIHEDWGATPAVIRASLDAGDELDMQIQIHTDTLNESGFFEDTMRAIGGRTIHTYHSEGAGGGHAPDIIRVAGEANCLPSSTNPTNPYTRNTFDEHLDMVMVCHHLNPRVPEDVAFAESRIRRETIAAEDVLHDLGAISALGSDSQGMGRIGETVARTWQLASKMKQQRGSLPEDAGSGNDNARIKRYIAKITINPARIYGIDEEVGSLEVGKLADIVLWEPKFFGIKPEVVFKGGFPTWSVMGESNASLMTCEPLLYRPQWGAYGPACQDVAVTFMTQAAIDERVDERWGLRKRLVATRGTRDLDKRALLHNDATPEITVDPETYRVEVNGELCTCEPLEQVPLGRLYVLK
ncbi:MAG: urease subunit alpha [Solirubrobacteraceae bacterium]|jgi:urease subunit alpha|nr:urease subunit alpha [Solirubrobacteraceae bacterium]MEA2322585.1 urease subunit alpha [Solirubrobacteraceae bacterium]